MRQKTWKRRLALVLAAAMTLNTGMLTSFAKWEQRGDDWYFTDDKTGEQIKGEVKKIHGEWYSFDQNGVMETDRRIDLDGAAFYITPGGEFAVNKWMFLDDEGHKCTHDGGCDCKWYRFGEIVKESGKPFSGGMVKDGLKEIHGKWYSFDPETGVMRSDELISGISKDKPWEIFYATESGDLAKGWMLLTAEGHKAKDDNDEVFWYFFKNPAKGNGMAYDEEREDEGKWYVFDEKGHMISDSWYPSHKSEGEYYYQHKGDRAVNKWLPFEDRNVWCHFDENGKVYEEEAFDDVASPSGAKRVVESIEPKGETDKEVLVGEAVKLEFQVATSNNAKRSNEDWSEYHDIWFGKLEQGRAKYAGSKGDICIVEYWNNNVNEEGEEITLFMDGVESTGSFKVRTVAPTSDKEVDKVLDNIEDSIKDVNNLTDEEKAEVAAQVRVAYEAASDDKKEKLQKEWLNSPKTLEELERVYAEANKLSEPRKSVTEDAFKLLMGEDAGTEDTVKIGMVGGNLNAEAGDSVELALAVPEEGWEDKLSDVEENVTAIKEDTITVALDLTFLLNNENQPQLKVPVVITMPLPASVKEAMANNMEAVLINIHADGIYLVESKIVENEITSEKEITFVTDKFSTYVFVLNSKPEEDPGTNPGNSGNGGHSSGGSSSGGGSRSTSTIAGTVAGQWMLDETGWWFRLSDGSYAVNSWQYLAYNGTARWYRFDEKGYICKGWFTDTDGHRYYLNPVSDGLMGAMLTGWQQIDGIWYYFNTVSDGTQGALLVNTTTPDGYNVDANGQWIQ